MGTKMERNITLYTDGSGTISTQPGGWAAILVCGEHVKELSGGSDAASNNEMEITAVYEGLKAIKRRGVEIAIVTDSQVVVFWLSRENARKTNYAQRLCSEIDYMAVDMDWTLKPTWIKGHAGNSYNERCDTLAGLERAKRMPQKDSERIVI